MVPLRIAAACLLTACTPDSRSIDPYPVTAAVTSGATVVGASLDDAAPRLAVVDTLSSLTMFSPDDGAVAAGRRRSVIGLWSTSAGAPTVKRAVFPDSTVFDLPPCAQPPCTLGEAGSTVEVSGVIGADLLSRGAMRFRSNVGTVEFLPDLAGSDDRWRSDCIAVVKDAFSGGGTLAIGGDEFNYTARHPTVRACLEPTPGLVTERSGADAFFVVSTAIGPTLISESAYQRLRNQVAGAPLETLPTAEIATLSGVVTGRRTSIASTSLIGEDARTLGGCGELFANRLMTNADCNLDGVKDCPCKSGENKCRAGAIVELDSPLDVIVIPDSNPLLQALRGELRPGFPEVDGILGTAALARMRVDFDYPNSRILVRCLADGCRVRPPVIINSATPACFVDDIESDAGP